MGRGGQTGSSRPFSLLAAAAVVFSAARLLVNRRSVNTRNSISALILFALNRFIRDL